MPLPCPLRLAAPLLTTAIPSMAAAVAAGRDGSPPAAAAVRWRRVPAHFTALVRPVLQVRPVRAAV